MIVESLFNCCKKYRKVKLGSNYSQLPHLPLLNVETRVLLFVVYIGISQCTTHTRVLLN